ncbi:MAG: hypothetical protein Q4G60_15385 [bacterium]|nr:hypothetical protein [bacterium]
MKNRVSFSLMILLIVMIQLSIVFSLSVDHRLLQMTELRNMAYLAERYEIYERGSYLSEDQKNREELERLQEDLDYEQIIAEDEEEYKKAHEGTKSEYLLRPREDQQTQYIKLVYAGSDPVLSPDYEMPMTRYYLSIYREQGNEDSMMLNTLIDDVDGNMNLFLYQEDVNQDGFMDLRLVRSKTDRGRDTVYIWNPKEENYECFAIEYQG